MIFHLIKASKFHIATEDILWFFTDVLSGFLVEIPSRKTKIDKINFVSFKNVFFGWNEVLRIQANIEKQIIELQVVKYVANIV